MWGEQKKQIYHYTMHTQIFTMFAKISIFAIFFQKYFNSKYSLTTYFNRELSNNSIWTSTDLPNTCRDIIVLFVSDTWISNTWIFNILFCTWRPGPGTRLCDTDSDMDNYTILQLISNHFTETFFFIYEINNWLIIESTTNLVYFN